MIKMVEIRKNSKIKKVLFMVLLLLFMFIDQNPEFQEEMQNTENVRENLLISPLAAEVHSKISIIGDTALDDFCYGNGTDGLSWATAYVIKDYEIDAGASGSAIEISDTTLYLIIQNCTVTNSESGYQYAGIYLNNCTNVKITGCNSSFNLDCGIYLYDSHDCIITGNNARNNTANGIYLEQSSNNTLSGNNLSFNEQYGILFGNYCDNNIISENLVSYNSWAGIYIYEFCVNNTISENNVSFSKAYGIYLYDYCDYNTISGNIVCNNSDVGIYIYDNCDNNIISKNNVSYNDYDGIFLEFECVNNTISENNVSFNKAYGIYIYTNCDNNTISGNNVSFNEYGIYFLDNCDNNIISGNTLCDNVHSGIYLEENNDNNTILGNLASFNEYGIYLEDLNNEDNTIWMNYFSDNSISQGNTTSPSNSWDNGTLGNYWGDFVDRYPDATSSNGIWWDCEYEVNTSSYNDTRPLVHPGFPEIESSRNVDYLIDDERNDISWTISDSTILDPHYWIYLDGVEIQTDSWGSGDIFSIDVDELSVGTYNYLLKCNDGTAWGWSESQIVVSVAEIPKPVIITISQTISTENITVEWSEVVGVDSYNVYINGTLAYNTDNLTLNIWLNETGSYSITVTAINGAEESEHSNAITIIVLIDDSNNNLFWYLFGGGWLLVAGFIGIAFVKVKMKK